MRTFKLLIVAAFLATSVAASAAEPGIAQELLAKGFSFPSSAIGTLEVKECTTCPTWRFQLTANTKYQVAEYPATYEQLVAAFEANPEALTFLMLNTNRRDVVSMWIGIGPAKR
jgi:hypothetical protein